MAAGSILAGKSLLRRLPGQYCLFISIGIRAGKILGTELSGKGSRIKDWVQERDRGFPGKVSRMGVTLKGGMINMLNDRPK